QAPIIAALTRAVLKATDGPRPLLRIPCGEQSTSRNDGALREESMVLTGRSAVAGLLALTAALTMCGAAHADTPLRVAKAVAYPFAYTPVDVGVAIGAFKQQGLEVEVTTFSGAPKMQQGLASDSVDIGIGGGTDMAFVAKGAPVLAIASTNIGPV